MMEDIGKFGSETALMDLVTRYGETERASVPLVMSIARFAIRGITKPEATRYVLRLCETPERAPWQAMYALQRIGDKPEVRSRIEFLATMFQHRNPLVRMNLATLLGKVKDEASSLVPLQKMADNDTDWRVKVNALKALGNFALAGKETILNSFRRAFFTEQPYVALTALTTIGTARFDADSAAEEDKLLADLRTITANKDRGYLWQLQAEAGIALAKLEGAKALAVVKPTDQAQPKLQAQILTAIGMAGDTSSAGTLASYLDDAAPDLRRAALDGLMELCRRNRLSTELRDRAVAAAIHALAERDVAVVTTAASMLGDSLLARPSSVGPLLEKLSSLNIPDDVEAIQEVCATLAKLHDARAVSPLEELLEKPDRAVGVAAADALKALTGTDYAGRINRSYEPLYTDFDFAYLRSLGTSPRVKVETPKGEIVLELNPEAAPFTVMSFLKLATRRGFYRGSTFHRVVPNFVIQGGDPRGDGWGGPGYEIRSEFSPLTYETGTLGVASAGKDTEGSQFFITQSPQPHLDGRYTIFGKVLSGMDVVNRILVDDRIFDVKPVDR
jgi:peptidylprolyl isomerase